MKHYKIIIKTILLALIIFSPVAAKELPIVTDNRIKTFIYDENQVYNLVVHYGYQSNIEFALGEEIETLSIGDSYAWKVTPVGRRLFIKPVEDNVHTNMTVITNKKRAYQFDVYSKPPEDEVDKNLVYVVRFLYLDEVAG